ncbi:BlaI/MecI/CopY family transcriptional regulator [Catenovulum sp. 2E275]|uniref:BlaI/MecI/CopY family transcriptional regulator n=1 Tax=Catenovulum sp. 2E275 TaxID=2980497 RepID=UPI0021CE6BF2|nr:BlaI/MecI/CopY family transcriptional regulator [Catenovulum sp. 2E275]MCU4675023.1 BlaI/MecI/CopY family transcriptional regulator [Catenovulum sp. 2E275]
MKNLGKGLSHWFGNRQKTTQVPSLGVREIEVLRILWREGELSAQQVLQFIENEEISLSTMQSTLERLFRKNLLSRQKSGRYYLYTASISQSAIISGLLQDIASQLSGGDMAPMISGFIEYVGEESPESLEQVKHSLSAKSQKTED